MGLMHGMGRLVRVFVSHTSDLAGFPEDRSYVQAVLDAVIRAKMVPIDMRYFTAREGPPADYCRQLVRNCDIYVAIVGFRYGSTVPGEKVSYTELEFDEATTAGKPRLVFQLSENTRTPADMTDHDRTAIDAFRQRQRDSDLVVRRFTTAAELQLEVFHALVEALDSHRPTPPRQLPADVYAFTGRAAELATLNMLLAPGGTSPLTVVAVSGTAGVGKSALAVNWAHRVASHFPDGHLYVDLRGYDPEQPMSPADALATLLGSLGIDGTQIPHDSSERAARYRTLLAGRRVLVILDNVVSTEQVRLLLPGSGSCVTLVTSRDRLAGLVARYGARRIDLDMLPLKDAVALLRTLIGRRVDSELDAATTLARQCARLPLALRIAAELAANRPNTRLTDLIAELTDAHRRLVLLDADGDVRTAVRAVFSWSYRYLPDTPARAFRLLGLSPEVDLDLYAATALIGTSVWQAQELLERLTQAHLVQSVHPGRYGMHDLLRAYAAALATKQESEEDRRIALERLFDHYLVSAKTATDVLHPAPGRQQHDLPTTESVNPSLADLGGASAWLNVERANLVAVCAHTAMHGWRDHTTRLAAVLARYLDRTGCYSEALAIHGYACDAARCTGDRAAEAHALTSIGLAHARQARHVESADFLEQARVLFHEAHDLAGEARAQNNLGLLNWRLCRYAMAMARFSAAVALFHEAASPGGEARALSNLGLVHWRQGRYVQAVDMHTRALTIYRDIGYRDGQANAIGNLAAVYGAQRRYEMATELFQQAIVIVRDVGDRIGEAFALDHLAVMEIRLGRHMEAAQHNQQALTLYRVLGHRYGETEAVNISGEIFNAARQPEWACVAHASALSLARQTGDSYQQARALDGLGHSYHALDKDERARSHWRQALALYQDMEVPEAADVRQRVDAPLG